MFERFRKDLQFDEAERHNQAMDKLDKERKISEERAQGLKIRKAAEEELRLQRQEELKTRKALQQATKERKAVEKELRGPSVVERTANITKRAIKGFSKLDTKHMGKVVMGDTTKIFGKASSTPPRVKMRSEDFSEYVFGKQPPTPKSPLHSKRKEDINSWLWR